MSTNIPPIFLEPEIQSGLFLLINLIGSILLRLFLGSWPLSLFYTSLYLIFLILINHALSAGSYYLPTRSLRGHTVVITGAATGIGRITAIRLARLGARVIIGVRGQERAEKVAREISDQSGGGNVLGYDLDLSSFTNVKEFAQKIDQVDILINNAGAVQESFVLTEDGCESQFQTNHLGHFYLTQLLLPLLTNGRVVNVSSLAHHGVRPTYLDYAFTELKTKYDGFKAYAFSKLAQIYHASELKRRYGIRAYSLHPGMITTTPINQRHTGIRRIIFRLLDICGKTIEQGAMTTLYCALSNDAKPGHFHSDCQVRLPSKLALDQTCAEQCWEESERLIQERIK